MKTKAGDALSCFFEGLLADEEEEDQKVSGKDIVLQYADKMLEVSKDLLKKGIQDDYEPLQIRILSLIAIIADVIEEDFGAHFNSFVQMLVEILQNV